MFKKLKNMMLPYIFLLLNDLSNILYIFKKSFKFFIIDVLRMHKIIYNLYMLYKKIINNINNINKCEINKLSSYYKLFLKYIIFKIMFKNYILSSNIYKMYFRAFCIFYIIIFIFCIISIIHMFQFINLIIIIFKLWDTINYMEIRNNRIFLTIIEYIINNLFLVFFYILFSISLIFWYYYIRTINSKYYNCWYSNIYVLYLINNLNLNYFNNEEKKLIIEYINWINNLLKIVIIYIIISFFFVNLWWFFILKIWNYKFFLWKVAYIIEKTLEERKTYSFFYKYLFMMLWNKKINTTFFYYMKEIINKIK